MISLTTGARLASDPNLRWLYALFAGAVVLIGLLMQFIALALIKREVDSVKLESEQPSMILRLALLVFLVAATCRGALADTVWLHAGGEYGQGYITARPSGCWLLTAAHVVAQPPVVVIGAEGRQGFVDAASIVADPKLDIAVMRISGDLAANCPGSPLGDNDTEAAPYARTARERRVEL